MKFSLRQLTSELWIEAGNKDELREDGSDEFEKYYNKVKKQFPNILKTAGINMEMLKVGREFEIDKREKELVKILIKNYDDRYVKGLRLAGSNNFSQEDRFKFLLQVERMLEEKFKGEELIEQKEMFYGYTHILSDFKAYSIKNMLDEFLNIEFSKMQNYKYRDISNEDERDMVDIQKKKIKAIHNMDESEYYELCKLEKGLETEFHGYYNITENDKVMILDMYQRIISDILNEMRIFAEKFSDVRAYEDGEISFVNKNSREVFLQAIDDYKKGLTEEDEPIPEKALLAVKELLDSRKKKRIKKDSQ
jgi:hypothetical protein